MRLRDEIRDAWKHMEVQQLPSYLKTDRDVGRYIKFISGLTWYDLDVSNVKISSECWAKYLPLEFQIYYFASFLDYCLKFYVDNVDDPEFADAEIPFLCCIDLAKRLVEDADQFSRAQIIVTQKVLRFILDHQEVFGYADHERVRQATLKVSLDWLKLVIPAELENTE